MVAPPEDVRDTLSRVELFQDLSARDLRAVASLAREVRCAQGDVIWRQGELGTTFYVVLSGQVGARVVNERGIERLDRILGAGETLGETSLLTGETHEATLVALTDCRLLCIQKPDFDELIHRRRGLPRRLRMRAEVRRKYEAPQFGWLEPGEVPTLFCRRHPAHMLPGLLLPALQIPVGGFLLTAGGGSGLGQALLWLGAFLVGVGGLMVLWVVVDWWNDFLMVTNRRVVQMERVLLFSEVRSEAGLEQIQDVGVTIRGILQHALGVGDVRLQTAGATGWMQFTFVSQPDKVKEEIFNRVRRARALERAAARGEIRQELERRLRGGPSEPPSPLPGEPNRLDAEPRPSLPSTLRRWGAYLVPRFREEENNVITWRKHWLLLLRRTGVQTLLLLGMGAAGIAAAGERWVCVPLLGLWAIFLFLWWYGYADWRNDIYQIQGGRIVDMTRRPLWGREVRKEGELARIQNVTYKMEGAVRNLLKVGDVLIETAGRTENFEFKGVYNPKEVANEIWRRLARERRQEQQKERERQRQDLVEWFEEYARLTREGGHVREPGES